MQGARFYQVYTYFFITGIRKMRIKRVRRGSRAIAIKVITGGETPRQKRCKGYSLASAVGNLIQAIKRDVDLLSKLTNPNYYKKDSLSADA